MVFDRVAAAVPIPLVSIVEATRDEAVRLGLRRPLLLGTRFTMEATFYPDAFARRGLGVTVPSPDDRTLVHGIYVGELLRNQFRPESRDVLVQLVERMQRTDGIDAVILGGTELPLLLRGALDGIIPVLDTTSLHVQAVVAQVGSRK
jgi:aspartate racemase